MPLKLYIVLTLLFSAFCGHSSQFRELPIHHTEKGFINTSKGDAPSFASILSWRLSKLFESDSPDFKLKVYKPELESVQKKTPTVTWMGHSTILFQFEGVNIITDPHFSMKASPVAWAGPERITPPAMTIEMLPKIHVVVISHDHYDHLDLTSVKFLAQKNGKNLQFFVPKGMKSWFLDNDIENVIELDWWQHHYHLGWKIEAVPAKHHSGRGLFDHGKRLWTGWTLKHPKFNFFYSGDTAYSEEFKRIGKKLGPFDLAIIPIGGYAPRRLFEHVHVNPEEAVQIHKDVLAVKSLGVHWGTFLLTDEKVDAPPKRLKRAVDQAKISGSIFTAAKYGKTTAIHQHQLGDWANNKEAPVGW